MAGGAVCYNETQPEGVFMRKASILREKGVFKWDGRADVAEFCRLAQKEGLWVILRPGPYSCAEWEGGGAPWWLLADDSISMRSSDPRWVIPATNWLHAVGRQLAGLQVTRGGPILMVQARNCTAASRLFQ